VKITTSLSVYYVNNSRVLVWLYAAALSRIIRDTNQRDSAYLSCESKDCGTVEGWDNLSAQKRASFALWGLGVPRLRMDWLAGTRRGFVFARGVGNQDQRGTGSPPTARPAHRLSIAGSETSIDLGATAADRFPRVGVRKARLDGQVVQSRGTPSAVQYRMATQGGGG
jgi:hypothetical protein